MLQVTSTLSTGPLDRLTAELRPSLERHIAATALAIQADAQARAPVRTGTLRRSITARALGALVWLVSVGAEYGFFVEYGTSRMAARPFFNTAIERQRAVFLAGVQGILRGLA